MSASAPLSLVERQPVVSAERLLGELVPPPRFVAVSLASYEPRSTGACWWG
ncbi:MAG: hypothetical protein H0U47_10685 [Nocardioidaceae bacterium]|nr:hypothetical protein [Nocardioidaceae bacterium]